MEFYQLGIGQMGETKPKDQTQAFFQLYWRRKTMQDVKSVNKAHCVPVLGLYEGEHAHLPAFLLKLLCRSSQPLDTTQPFHCVAGLGPLDQVTPGWQFCSSHPHGVWWHFLQDRGQGSFFIPPPWLIFVDD